MGVDFLVGLAAGFLIGGLTTLAYTCFVMGSGNFNKEHEAYMQGYNDGLKNANKNKEKEVV